MTTPTTAPTHPRRLRADAERNRARILNAARTLFTQHGTHVSMDEVARHAQVGIGTLYRHFPTKDAMVETASQQRFGEILTYYHTISHNHPEPLEALHLLLTRIAEVETRDRGFATAHTHTNLGSQKPPSPLRENLETQLVQLTTQGQHQGTIRTDIHPTDILPITCGLTAIAHHQTGDYRQYITITLDGLKPQQPTTN
ncbi:TetR/AcrR family transcriptional regulator [Streptomyces sp. N2-109]|uniref:TetR/AcrR family transcriptional regulator n=1 Tax=Streptomyces gossypii TaxID=2883101 RepID=A0ABT2JL74_9ACTN|nr:TetR/AcrR family transcriptional regulator [Streptomyces gossypii]MCT2588468.1 TetR/AcrR family transcriptional regulator [Streptomyces gossypii]